jgi:hypothetical protein
MGQGILFSCRAGDRGAIAKSPSCNRGDVLLMLPSRDLSRRAQAPELGPGGLNKSSYA